MTPATIAPVDRRSHDVITLPRSGVEESWMDVQAETFEVRRDVARAYVDQQRGADPRAHLFKADRRLVRLTEYARQRAGEAAGISYIAPGQMPLPDGCGPDGRAG